MNTKNPRMYLKLANYTRSEKLNKPTNHESRHRNYAVKTDAEYLGDHDILQQH